MGSVINGRTHTFHADASAFGGHIELPFEQIVAAQAPVTLAPDGGYSTARADNFRVEGLFSFKSAYTQTSGIVSRKRPGWTTLATSVIEGLNVSEILTADRVVAQIITEHPAEMGKYAPMVNFVGTRIDNLRIGSCQIDIELNLDLCNPEKTDQHGFPEKHTMDDQGFLQRVKGAGQYNSAGGEKSQILCSLFEKATIKGKLPGTLQGNVLTIPGFGKAILAELIVDANTYHLSMLRLQLGSPTHGSVSAGNVSGNGSSEP
jgi:hypothetical protein